MDIFIVRQYIYSATLCNEVPKLNDNYEKKCQNKVNERKQQQKKRKFNEEPPFIEFCSLQKNVREKLVHTFFSNNWENVNELKTLKI